ncbi:hypothetical protein ALI44B_11990 [Leifsonia sp. ALI-44-B]|jgi:hypothetical protein|uniref:hypothetical protein n=1 Tax=Leifsonia sp. ALI-44-B TaxID=1933776 RepID=UPI00097C36BF|nr:hypothetical protein [Leifsonia sp. ALI-44-B]ONI61193.1 hypothetical protein ALI44B_11990 [Leifsonia sp. ALI-44-B]
MNPIEKHAHEAFSGSDPLRPLEVPSDAAPVLATPALGYGALTFAAFMAGNVVTDFVGDESPTEGGIDELVGKSGSELLALRAERLTRG